MQQRQARLDRRRRSRHEQYRAGEEGEGAGDLRGDRRDEHRGALARTREMRARGAQLLVGEEDCAEEERHEKVDRTVGEERAEERLGGNAAQDEQHHRLEDADPARHVAHDSGDDRDGIGADERDEADVRARTAAATRAPSPRVLRSITLSATCGKPIVGPGARSAQPRISRTPRDSADQSA